MIGEKVSVITPVKNEEKNIEKAARSLKSQNYSPMEIIMVVNNSSDRSYEIAKSSVDKVLNFDGPIGVCQAKNEGAEIADGEIFIFIDADSFLSPGSILKISQVVKENTFGSVLGKGDNNSFRGKLFFFYRNWSHRLRIYQGVVDGVFFCHRDIFRKSGGFNESMKIGEYKEIMARMRKLGGEYKLMTDCWAEVSLRRYEEKGYFKTYFFWISWKIAYFFKKDKKIAGKYFDN